jgi:hypothetical protein
LEKKTCPARRTKIADRKTFLGAGIAGPSSPTSRDSGSISRLVWLLLVISFSSILPSQKESKDYSIKKKKGFFNTSCGIDDELKGGECVCVCINREGDGRRKSGK